MSECVVEYDFGKVFNQSFSGESMARERILYCIKKHVINHHLIDTGVFKVDLNPAGIDVEGLDCDEMIKKRMPDVNEQILQLVNGPFLPADSSEAQLECAVKKYDELKFVENYMVIMVLGQQFDHTDEQKSEERRKFFGAATKLIIIEVIKCGV